MILGSPWWAYPVVIVVLILGWFVWYFAGISAVHDLVRSAFAS